MLMRLNKIIKRQQRVVSIAKQSQDMKFLSRLRAKLAGDDAELPSALTKARELY